MSKIDTGIDSDIARVYSPRPDSPEPDSRQGRRNAPHDVQLLDGEGSISDQVCTIAFPALTTHSTCHLVQFEQCLLHIFAKYCTPPPPIESPSNTNGQVTLLKPPPGAYLTPAGLDKWAIDTNGHPFSDETKAELQEFMDVTDEGDLTCVTLGMLTPQI